MAGRGQVLNIEPAVCGVIHGHLYRRVAFKEVSTDDVSLDARSQKDPIRIPDGRVLLDHVAGVGGSDKADAKVAPLSYVAVSTKPVRTEPVAAGASGQSYAATGIVQISISH